MSLYPLPEEKWFYGHRHKFENDSLTDKFTAAAILCTYAEGMHSLVDYLKKNTFDNRSMKS